MQPASSGEKTHPTSKTSFEALFQTPRIADFSFCAIVVIFASSTPDLLPSSAILRNRLSQRGNNAAIS